MRFASQEAVYRAHPGDNSRLVPLVVSEEEYQRLFISRRSPIADLRNLDSVVQLPFKRGDVNSSGEVDISDPISLLGYLFSGKSPAPSCPDAADANDDGSLDASDSISMLQWLFRDGREPPAPGPRRCGLDRTLTSPPLPPCAPGPGSCAP